MLRSESIMSLQQMRKEEMKKEDEKVHFYLPLSVCKDCPNKNRLVEKRGG